MTDHSYRLCGIPLTLCLPEEIRPTGPLERFRRSGPAEPGELRYEARWYSGLFPERGTLRNRQPGYRALETPEGWQFRYNVGYGRNPYELILDLEPRGGLQRLWLPEVHRDLLCREGLPAAQNLGQELLLLSRKRLPFHAALVSWKGRGILFTGPSGMGKSTQAGLWRQCFGAEILNGDKAVVQTGRELLAWGSPYAGTSGIYRNECAPLRAIVTLGQGPENRIRRLEGREALFALMPRMATAPWAGDWYGRGVDLALGILERIPVYELFCRPEPSAAELTRKTLFPEEQEDGE